MEKLFQRQLRSRLSKDARSLKLRALLPVLRLLLSATIPHRRFMSAIKSVPVRNAAFTA